MKWLSLAVSLLMLILVLPAMAEQPAGQVVGNYEPEQTTRYVTVPVYHDTTGRTDADLTERERHFLSTVPTTGGLRDAVREMVLANVVHVPALKCGNYTPGDSVHYWSIYQAWTGKAKARVPLVPGPRGERGEQGGQGPMGPQGPQGPAGQTVALPQTIINNFAPAMWPSAQMLGPMAPMVVQTQLGGVAWVRPTRISVIATGGTGGSVGPITNNNANSHTNVNANNNAINIGDGSAAGSASGSGTSAANAGQ